MKALKEFEEIYADNKNFNFDYEEQTISFSNSQSKKEKFLFGLFISSFIVIMMQIGNRNDFSISFLVYSILIGIFISIFSLIGKNEFEINFANQTFIRKSLLKTKTLNFSEIKDIKIVKSYLNSTFINYRIDIITKNGKVNYPFIGERDKIKAEEVLKWSEKYLNPKPRI